MTTNKYILDGNGNPIIEPDLMKWADWFQNIKARVVKREAVGDCEVSTVFLGLDHNYCDEGPPVLWETMVFGGKHDQDQNRCSGSREQAEAMHEAMVRFVKGEQTP